MYSSIIWNTCIIIIWWWEVNCTYKIVHCTVLPNSQWGQRLWCSCSTDCWKTREWLSSASMETPTLRILGIASLLVQSVLQMSWKIWRWLWHLQRKERKWWVYVVGCSKKMYVCKVVMSQRCLMLAKYWIYNYSSNCYTYQFSFWPCFWLPNCDTRPIVWHCFQIPYLFGIVQTPLNHAAWKSFMKYL